MRPAPSTHTHTHTQPVALQPPSSQSIRPTAAAAAAARKPVRRRGGRRVLFPVAGGSEMAVDGVKEGIYDHGLCVHIR